MGFLSRLMQLFGKQDAASSPRYTVADGHGLWVFVQCNRCQEKIKLRLRKTDELQRAEEGKDYQYFVRKSIIGTKCFCRMDAFLKFDRNYRLVDPEITNGCMITEDACRQDESTS